MQQTSTQFDMIAYLYGEATPAQVRATENAIAADPVVRRELTELVEAQASLPKVAFSAPRRLMRALRNYASGPDLQLSL
ncbi:hypothetical protein [Lewinella sp. 4G2]|uniref:hypothetical protein n=1 Tax=Lewinella sp. 4G2 TaxID=1803372 RepID=UPI0007B46C3F|nr:hypothetical protein [Lewinella sp. 4G2]OAV44712.1 hypothetical protein A3850_009510 [Lewinella sp. 4G2]